MFGNSFNHQLDAKNRMRIPAKLRVELGDQIYITAGPGGCLNVYSEEGMKEVKEILGKVNQFRENQLRIGRFILYNTWAAEEDKQGRFRLPDNLKEYAKIDKNVIIFKGPSCIEIWAEEVWKNYLSDINFDELADAVDALKHD